MSDQATPIQPVNPIFQDPAEAMGNFYFLIFTADPSRDKVKIWVDDGSVKLYMKRDKFYDLIEKLIDYKTSQVVHEACTTYGCFYALDRVKKTVEKLHANAEHKHLNPAKDFMNKHKNRENNNDSIEAQYGRSLDDWADRGLRDSWITHNKNDNDSENRIV